MARRIPLPAAGTLALGLTAAAGCAEDPLVGAWSVTEMDDEAMPYIYSSTYYGDVVYSASMRMFSDLVGYVTYSMQSDSDTTMDYYGQELTIKAKLSESDSSRAWARSTGENTYVIVAAGDDLNCSLTLLTLLSCVDDSDDEPMTVILKKDAEQ